MSDSVRLAQIEGKHDDCQDDWCAYFTVNYGQHECDVLWLIGRIRELEREVTDAYGKGRDDEANGVPDGDSK